MPFEITGAILPLQSTQTFKFNSSVQQYVVGLTGFTIWYNDKNWYELKDLDIHLEHHLNVDLNEVTVTLHGTLTDISHCSQGIPSRDQGCNAWVSVLAWTGTDQTQSVSLDSGFILPDNQSSPVPINVVSGAEECQGFLQGFRINNSNGWFQKITVEATTEQFNKDAFTATLGSTAQVTTGQPPSSGSIMAGLIARTGQVPMQILPTSVNLNNGATIGNFQVSFEKNPVEIAVLLRGFTLDYGARRRVGQISVGLDGAPTCDGNTLKGKVKGYLFEQPGKQNVAGTVDLVVIGLFSG